MNRLVVSACVVTLVALVAVGLSPLAPEEPAPENDAPTASEELAGLAYLAGEWQGKMGDGVFHAYYSTPEGGRVMSHSRLMTEGREAFYEFELFEVRDGKVALQPFPGGKKAGGFTLTALDPQARSATFENPAKDFPTRIVYHRVADDRLVITLSDPHHAPDTSQVFDLRRP